VDSLVQSPWLDLEKSCYSWDPMSPRSVYGKVEEPYQDSSEEL
jgi:hypothetical protein